MSLTSKQIDELRAYAKDRKGELAKLINDAADTIEMLSAKLHASQMERSSQYYHDGWIPCSEMLPEEGCDVLITKEPFKIKGYKQEVIKAKRSVDPRSGKIKWWSPEFGTLTDKAVLAWMPLPEPARLEGE